MFTSFDSLTEPLSHSHSLLGFFSPHCHPLPFFLPLHFPSFSLPFVLPHFVTLLLSPPLLQLFLAGSCVQWLSPPQKQKTLREEWFEYRFVPQSSEFYPFFFRDSRSPSKKCLHSRSLEAFQSLMCCNWDSDRGSKESSKKWSWASSFHRLSLHLTRDFLQTQVF